MSLVDSINQSKYLYLHKAWEEKDLELNIEISEATASDDGTSNNHDNYNAIVTDASCKSYKIVFRDYVAWNVLNESYSQVDNEEVFEGNVFRVYTKSKYLEFIDKATVASDDYPGPLKHFEIVCLNHIVDIVTSNGPEVSEI